MLADLALLVDDLAPGSSGRLTDGARDRAIAAAVRQYGVDRPRLVVTDIAVVAGAAGLPASLPLPAGWEAGFSDVAAIEYPVGRVPARLLQKPAFERLETPLGPVIGLNGAIAAGELCRLTWTASHRLDATTDTIPAADREAVAWYAAAILFDALAAAVSGDREPTIQSDSVDHQSAAREYAARATTARRRYYDLIGLDPKREAPACAIAHPPLATTTALGRLTARRPWHG